MILLYSKGITTWLIRNGVVKAGERELYEYAVHSLALSLAPLVIVVIMGGFMGVVKESILFILPFMAIRKFSGGFHAKHEWICLMSSCGLLFLCVFAVSKITYNVALGVVTLGAVISLSLFSPIDSDNRRLSADEKIKYRRITHIMAGLFFGIFVLLAGLRAKKYAGCIAVGLILSASLQFPCLLQRLHFKQGFRQILIKITKKD